MVLEVRRSSSGLRLQSSPTKMAQNKVGEDNFIIFSSEIWYMLCQNKAYNHIDSRHNHTVILIKDERTQGEMANLNATLQSTNYIFACLDPTYDASNSKVQVR